VKLILTQHRWHMVAPFVTAGETVNSIDVLHVMLQHNGTVGRAETMGVDYFGETAETLHAELLAVDPRALEELNRQTVQTLLPPGGSRNGLDCALWDLQAKQTAGGISALTGITLTPLNTLFTLSLDDPEAMARRAHEVPDLKRLKLKLNAQAPLDCLQAIREARPDAQLVIDANGSWTPEVMMAVGDGLARFGVALLEQPLPHEDDAALEHLRYPVPLCADESCQSSTDLEAVADRYDAINIKLDKCGGLTDALAIREWCRHNKKLIMVGNMLGSSLAMAPALVVAQGADFVDLDGPLWQTNDVESPLAIMAGRVQPPAPELWG
jgi:L-alanine-DL-glutamate epimerase-like enolase superfamily enzyme